MRIRIKKDKHISLGNVSWLGYIDKLRLQNSNASKYFINYNNQANKLNKNSVLWANLK